MTILATASASHTYTAGGTLQMTKYRELSANTVSFITSLHTSEKADKLTLTSTPPKAQPGNAGVSRTLLNRQRQVVINEGLDNERIVPIVVKLEVSMPVGADADALDDLLHDIQAFTVMDDASKSALFVNAIIPQ